MALCLLEGTCGDPLGAYMMWLVLACFCLRWLCCAMHRNGAACIQTCYGIIHEACAIAVLMLSHMDRRWIIDTTWNHPYDPLFPITLNPKVLRLWQQFWLAVLWLSLCATFGYRLDQEVSGRALPLAGCLLAMWALVVSDLMLCSFQHIIAACLLAVLFCRSVDHQFEAKVWLMRVLALPYMFSGLNKVNPSYLSDGFPYLTAELAPMLSSEPKLKFVGGLFTALMETALGFGLIALCCGRAKCCFWIMAEGTVLGGLIGMHALIVVVLSLKHWNYVVIPINVACAATLSVCYLLPYKEKTWKDLCISLNEDIESQQETLHSEANGTKCGGSCGDDDIGSCDIVSVGIDAALYRRKIGNEQPVRHTIVSDHALAPEPSDIQSFRLHPKSLLWVRAVKGTFLAIWLWTCMLGPASWLLSTNPPWINNAGSAFTMYCFNDMHFNSSHPLPSLNKRMMLLSHPIPDGQFYLRSNKGILKFAEWAARQAGHDVAVDIKDKLPIGFARIEGQAQKIHRYNCRPECVKG